jgi:hypothetical protein
LPGEEREGAPASLSLAIASLATPEQCFYIPGKGGARFPRALVSRSPDWNIELNLHRPEAKT